MLTKVIIDNVKEFAIIIMEVKPNVKLEPLYEDVLNVVGGQFLLSTAFKRWLVKVEFAEIWDKCKKIVEDYCCGVVIYGDIYEAYACSTLILLLNHFYEKNGHEHLVKLVQGILQTYSQEKKEKIEVGLILKDLAVAGIETVLVKKIKTGLMSCASEGMDVSEKEELSEQEQVRALERSYKGVDLKEANTSDAIKTYREWHSAAVVYFSKYYTSSNADYVKFKNIDNSGNGYTLKHNFDELYSIYNLLMSQANSGKPIMVGAKTPMIFISHSSKDKAFVEPLVELLEALGFDESNLFCSSVDGYGVALGDNIFDKLKSLFLEHELYVLFVHSPRYYGSTVSLNEMGAAWVLRVNYFSILTKDMEYGKMNGVVNSNTIAIKVNSSDARARLTELKDSLCKAFSLESISQTKWERKRDQFLQMVNKIEYSNAEKQESERNA